MLKVASSNPQLQLGIMAGLATLVSDCPPNQIALQSTDFIDVLAPQFPSIQGQSQEQCLRILMHLSKNQQTNEQLVSYFFHFTYNF